VKIESGMPFHRRNLPHLQRDNKPHFVTCVTKNRRVLPGWAREIVLSSCRHDHEKKYDLRVAIVMPDHVHLILTPLVDAQRQSVVPMQDIMKAIKGASAHAINQRRSKNGAVWQEESFDRVLRCSEKLDEKIAYILNNPVRRGIVNDWHQYQWLWYLDPPNPYAPRTNT
jgi:REP element-mobilizing transposase RayT